VFHFLLVNVGYFTQTAPRVSRPKDFERPLNARIVQEIKEKGVNLVWLKELVVREFNQLNVVLHAPNFNTNLLIK
jgi:hypothetical protein